MTSGIYLITVSRIGLLPLYYVGKSARIEWRFMMHVYSLRRGRHSNCYMQHAFDKYGEEAFALDILEEFSGDLSDLEQWWLDEMVGHSRVMNICTGSVGGTMPEETRRKISKKLLGNKSKGKRPSLGVIEGTRYDGKTVRFDSAADAARSGFSACAISRCIRGQRKTHNGYRWRRIRPSC